PLDTVGGQPFAQRLDDGDATGHCSLEGHHHAARLSGREDLVAMHGKQCLVGGDHVLAVLDGLEHQFAGHAIAADQLDDDVDVRIAHHRESVVGELHTATGHRAGMLEVLVRHRGDADRPPGAPGDFFLVTFQNVEGAAADGTDAQQAYVDRFHAVCFR